TPPPPSRRAARARPHLAARRPSPSPSLCPLEWRIGLRPREVDCRRRLPPRQGLPAPSTAATRYRGTLPGAGEVAIKRLRPGSGQGDREFRAEVEIISRVHHRHLVSLVGYCIHGDQRLLVYEFVPNKTLEFHLHGTGQPTLAWPARWKIALGSAKGLAYLHEDCEFMPTLSVIPRLFIATLDFNFEPKVSDFGLARIQAGSDTHVSTHVMGTFGIQDTSQPFMNLLA
ncbi:hypothetical protein EJB05_23908, partial [Eragrostis curvula]